MYISVYLFETDCTHSCFLLEPEKQESELQTGKMQYTKNKNVFSLLQGHKNVQQVSILFIVTATEHNPPAVHSLVAYGAD